jgi:peptidoglycan DL-endopeptidase LytE
MSKEACMKSIYLFITTIIVAVFISGNSYADVTYKVKKGDNPYTIAKKFKASPDDIIRINTIDPDHLLPGTRITIPSHKSVKSRKARSHHTTMSKAPGPVQEIGQKLTIKQTTPSDYEVQKGDTVWNIARRFEIDPEELIKINSLETESLRPGQKILVKHAEPRQSKPYEAILSQAHEEMGSEQISEHLKATEFGLQDRLILFAKKMLDIPYRFGGNSPLGIDCSAYVKKVYSLIGVNLPRSAREQFKEGIPVEEDNLSIGDLVFFKTYASYPSHVGIYLGNNLFIHASSKSKKVTIDSLATPFYLKRFIGAKRLLDMSAQSQDSEKEG